MEIRMTKAENRIVDDGTTRMIFGLPRVLWKLNPQVRGSIPEGRLTATS